ncbi:MAG: glutathione peroxidase [Fimbriimonadaceae bacterium]|nr:glutathione peroxidase [Fimbriimonadaceae bacterium]
MTDTTPREAKAKSIYDFTMTDIDGKETPLKKFEGKVVMIVNTASRCGLTPQYEGLEKIFDEYKEKGFVVLGFPANDFMGQEPGTNEEIKEFCTSRFNVSFPMFSKISVKGEGAHPLYQWLLTQTDNKKDIEWNFAKFLVGRDGQVRARFSSRTAPDAKEIREAIEKELSAK